MTFLSWTFATFARFRQIESGMKIPSLPVFVDICNALRISPDFLLRDELVANEVSKIHELEKLWETAAPTKQELAAAMIKAVLEHVD